MNLRNRLVLWGDGMFYTTLTRELSGMKSVLDIGCGSDSPLGKVKKTYYSVGFDIFKPALEKSKKKRIHDDYKVGNVLRIEKLFRSGSFDSVIALDLIEHLEKKDGYRLLEKMEKIARKKVIVLTPNGYYNQEEYEDNPYQVHHSGWTVDDFTKQGYTVFGMRGLKTLRGEYATIKYPPWLFWAAVSTLSEFPLYYVPRYAYQLFAVKQRAT